MLNPGELFTPHEAAKYLKVNVCSVYQSLPGSRSRSKLGRSLPEPIRLGRLIRWTGQQLMDFAVPPQLVDDAVSQIVETCPIVEIPRRGPGRPRNVVAGGGAA